MMSFRKRFLPLAMVGALAVFGVACEADDNGDVEDPAVEDDAGTEGEEDPLEGEEDPLEGEEDLEGEEEEGA